MNGIGAKRDNALLTAVRAMVVLAVVLACLRIAWLSDDALITLRTALNVTHGWGPGFNATESVQAYTHPLWFLIWVAIGAASNQWILGILALGFICTGLAVAILACSTRSIPRLILAAVLLVLSNAFVEYASSGLENPLAYLFISILLAMTLAGSLSRIPRPVLAALAGLALAGLILTRFDLALLVIPIGVYACVRVRRDWQVLCAALLGSLLPLVTWFTWSKATYDAWLPNTFEAKRNLNIPQSELLIQGFRYLWVTFAHDLVSLAVIAAGILLAALCGTWVARMWALGIVIYLAYVVWVGGDFMAGRFMAVPVFACVFLVTSVHLPRETDAAQGRDLLAKIATVGVVAVMLAGGAALSGSIPTSLQDPQVERWKVDQNFNAGVSDERGVYVSLGRDLKTYLDKLSLAYLGEIYSPIGDGTGLNRGLRDLDREARAWPTANSRLTTPSEVATFCGFLGTIGIATGPTTHLIDRCALTDRYLASIPFTPSSPFAWKPGHFERVVPDGYEDAVRANDPQLMKDPAQRFYLEKLWSRVRG